jgi:excisionase family DNA binding protein
MAEREGQIGEDMASPDSVRLVGGGSPAVWGIGVLFAVAFDSLGGGLYEILRAGEVPKDASYIIQAVLPPHLRSLKQGMEKLRQGLDEYKHTLLEVEKVLEAEAEAEEDSSRYQGIGAAILSIADVCQELGMSKGWVYQRLRSGEIPSLRLGNVYKIRCADLEEYVKTQRYPYSPAGEVED